MSNVWVIFKRELAAYFGAVDPSVALSARTPALALGLPLAVGTAVYTAFLFGQAEGRDLWQSTLLPGHLLLQALMMGAATVMVMQVFLPLDGIIVALAKQTLLATLVLDLLVTLLGEFGMPHASEIAARAAHDIRQGRYRNHFWLGSIGLGHVVPAVLLLATAHPVAGGVAAVAVALGLYAFEYAFVMAPQHVPNS